VPIDARSFILNESTGVDLEAKPRQRANYVQIRFSANWEQILSESTAISIEKDILGAIKSITTKLDRKDEPGCA
jgi:hypothetical protein